MSSFNIDFSDIRIILCVQGYHLDYQFIVREIGFWCKDKSGSIPFNCKVNKNQLDCTNQQIITHSEEEIHGIKLKKNFEFGLALSEVRAVLRTLYHINSGSDAKYIGIIGDDIMKGLLFKAGLGSYVIDVNYLNVFKQTNTRCPTNEMIITHIKLNPEKYSFCTIHERLKNNESPICARIKAEFIANYCLNFSKSISSRLNIEMNEILKDIEKDSNITLN